MMDVSMQGISGIILIIIVACLLPYVFTLIAKSKGGFQAQDNQNPRDFFLCTNENDYNILAKSPFNAVLQKSTPSTDDGSLSWAALGKKTRYINIETRLGWLSVQKKMLKYLEENIP